MLFYPETKMQKYKAEQIKKYLNECHFYYSYRSVTHNFTRNDNAAEEFLHIF